MNPEFNKLVIMDIQPQNKVGRPVSTAIYFLVPSGSVSRLHRIPCAETWHFYLGEPLTVFELHDDGRIVFTTLGLDLEAAIAHSTQCHLTCGLDPSHPRCLVLLGRWKRSDQDSRERPRATLFPCWLHLCPSFPV
ncbi:hypothetical protein HPP92_003946 [Vanilla planifolia]|uniref:DUF985 domain-containing protein n=1 Tax=Vanilla planifolia TaxID=51239 RepID=A0A835VKE5_VANPL|nr:hypothetical protein HPP92_003946 [Vanilla planifolia]